MIKYLLLFELTPKTSSLVVDIKQLPNAHKLGDVFFVSNGQDLLAWMKLVEVSLELNLATLEVIDWDFDGEQQ